MFWNKKQKEVVTDEARIDEVLTRGVAEVIDKKGLRERMHKGERLRVKLGIDPTSPAIHIGNAVTYLKLRDFQKLGHVPVIIIGNATSVIGDTSDKDSERPMLERRVVEENAETYLAQIGKLVDLSGAEVKYNAEWLDTLTYQEIGDQADAFSVADFIARDNIKRRLGAGKRVSLREVLYPLMQGYDSVAVHADVELGGTDQRFNLLAGRTLQQQYDQSPQDILMTNLIEGTDGNMMSKSVGNTIDLTSAPEDMYGKVMRIHDDLIEKYFLHCTRVSMEEIQHMKQKLTSENPKPYKERLAFEIVRQLHGEESAVRAQKSFTETFSERGTPEDIEELKQRGNIRETLVAAKVVASSSAYRRLADAGAIKNVDTGDAITDPNAQVTKPTRIKIGKKEFRLIRP